jgi:hypothetical protein
MHYKSDDRHQATSRAWTPHVVCAWCSATVTPGDPEHLSHGICDDCLPPLISELDSPGRLAPEVQVFL